MDYGVRASVNFVLCTRAQSWIYRWLCDIPPEKIVCHLFDILFRIRIHHDHELHIRIDAFWFHWHYEIRSAAASEMARKWRKNGPEYDTKCVHALTAIRVTKWCVLAEKRSSMPWIRNTLAWKIERKHLSNLSSFDCNKPFSYTCLYSFSCFNTLSIADAKQFHTVNPEKWWAIKAVTTATTTKPRHSLLFFVWTIGILSSQWIRANDLSCVANRYSCRWSGWTMSL